ncbi:MAG: DUF2800 domain-containing protein [Colwellia sp.]|nr:DUF2800 domain-containing protein [Colwellia sp.]
MSGSYVWMEGCCSASIRMSNGFPEMTTPAAELGTSAHELGEFTIALGCNIRDCLGLTFNNNKVNHKMIDDVSIYTNYLSAKNIQYGIKPLLEQRVIMSSMGRNDIFGTSDANFITVKEGVLEIVDYKNGYVVVEAENNPQTAGYGVATLDTFNLWDKINTVITTIIQPNSNHRDGPIRQCHYTINQMRAWQEKYRRSIALTEDKTQKPRAGAWCTYCKAQSNCRARIEMIIEKAYTNVPFEELSIGELEVIYREITGIKHFIEKVKSRVLTLGMKGRKFEGYKLVASYGRAKCKDEEGLVKYAINKGHEKEELYNTKLKSKTDLKQVLSEKVVQEYFVSPTPGKKLVPMHDNSPAIRVEGDFSAFNQYKIKE